MNKVSNFTTCYEQLCSKIYKLEKDNKTLRRKIQRNEKFKETVNKDKCDNLRA